MVNQSAVEARTDSVDVKEYLAILLKRKWLVLVCFLLSMAGTTAFLFTRQPIYRATTKLLVTTTSALPAMEVNREDEQSFYATQFDVMKSQTMLRRVQQRLKKTSDELRENLAAWKIYRVGTSDIIAISVDSPSTDFARDFANAMAEEFLRYREEKRAESTEAALLMLTREINRLSQEVKSAQERYLTYARDNNLPLLENTKGTWWRLYDMARENHDRCVARLNNAVARLASLERPTPSEYIALLGQAQAQERNDSASQIASRSNLPTPSEPSSLQLDSSEIAGTSSSEEAAQISATASSPAPEPAESKPTGAESSVTTAYPGLPGVVLGDLVKLELSRVSLASRVEELSTRYRPLHPALLAANRELENVNQQIRLQMDFARNITKAEIQDAQRALAVAKEKLDSFSASAVEKSMSVMQGSSLAQELSRVRSQYNALLNQLLKIDVAQGFRVRTVSVLEPALVDPDPVYPKKMKGLMVAAFFGVGLGLALAFFIEYIDDSIKLAEEVERDLQLPFLGMIPAAQWSPDDLTAHRLDKLKQQGGVAESYRVVRSAIIFSTPREKLRSILLTSAVPREGKTTTCVNLSIGFAQIEERVLLIDADLRRGEIHKYFGFEREKGLSDVLLGEMTPEQVVHHTNVPKLDVITSGNYPANPAKLLLGWRLKETLEWAYKNYDRVIVDCTPVMGIADSAILGSAVDGCLFVIWAGRTSRRYVRVAKMTAVSRGAKIFGFVLNNLEPGRVGYYHYYPYYYSYYSRGYYYAKADETEAGKGGDVKGIEVPSPEGGEEKIDDVY